MSQRERNEWIERAKQRVLSNARITDTYLSDIMEMYDETANQLENEIRAMYQKYGDDNGLSEAEAAKLLTGEEYTKWKRRIDDYIVCAENDSKILLELNTLSAKSRISRKEQLLSNIYRNMMKLSGDTETKLTELLGDMYTSNYYRSCFDIQSMLKVGFSVSKIDEITLHKILSHPWADKTFSEAIWENTDKLAALARREITMGFMSGASVQKIAKEIDDVMQRGRYNATRLVRTESNYFANQGELASYQELGVQKYIYLGGGCDICQMVNGGEFLLSEGKPGENMPPMHPNCKCAIRAKVDRDLFKDRGDANPLRDNPKFDAWKKKYVRDKAPEPLVKLTDEEQYAMNSYISSSAYTWNDKLRRDAHLSRAEKKLIADMDSALKKMPTYEGTVKRSVSGFGIEDVQKFVASHVPGSKRRFTEFLSSSEDVYDDTFPIQYVIQSKTGRNIQKFNPGEREILFERDTIFRITKVDGNTIYMEEI